MAVGMKEYKRYTRHRTDMTWQPDWMWSATGKIKSKASLRIPAWITGRIHSSLQVIFAE